MFRRFSALCLIGLFVLTVAPAAAQQTTPASTTATMITVTNLNDDGAGSLRQAIADSSSGGTITFDPSLKGTITLTHSLNISRDLSIIGPISLGVSLNGMKSPGIIVVSAATRLLIANVVVENSSGGLGGVANEGGLVTISNSIFQNNNRHVVILNYSKTSLLTINTTKFVDNNIIGNPIILNLGRIAISNSDFENDTGTILDNSGNAVINSSLVSNNGIFNHPPHNK